MKFIGYIIINGESCQFASHSKKGVLDEIRNLLKSQAGMSHAQAEDARLNVEAADCVTIGNISAGLTSSMCRIH